MGIDRRGGHTLRISSPLDGRGSVYVIGPEGGPFKVGVSHDPHDRMQTLQTGSPIVLRLHFHEPCASPEVPARLVEAWAHALLNHSRTHGEWFACTLDDAITAVSRAAREAHSLDRKPPARPPRRGPVGLTSAEKRRARKAMAEHAWIMGELRGNR